MTTNKKVLHPVRRILLILLAVLLAGVFLYSQFRRLQAEYTKVYRPYQVSQGDLVMTRTYDSSIALKKSQTVTAEKAGKIRQVRFSEGDTVHNGDLILQLSSGDQIRAELDGTVNQIPKGKGESYEAGETLLQIADFSHVEVSFSVDEYGIPNLRVGQPCVVTVDAINERYSSSIKRINYVGTESRGVANYRVTVPLTVSEHVHPGMQVTVTVEETAVRQATLVSKDALSFDSKNQAFVYLMDENGKMKEHSVTLGTWNDSTAEIVDGLTAGQTVYAAVVEQSQLEMMMQMIT